MRISDWSSDVCSSDLSISQPGAAPTEIENQITQRVEAAVRSINGVSSINSTAREGNSNTTVEFEIGVDPNDAVAEVKNAVDTVRGSLPEGILEPRISKIEVAGGLLGIYAVEADDLKNRKSVVWGKRGSVRVDIRARRINEKKKKRQQT